MKKFLYTALLLVLISCGSSKSFQSFYNEHKNDVGVTAFQVPNFMKGLLGSISPEVGGLFNNIQDFKFITFNEIDKPKQTDLISQMNLVTTNSYKDVFRQNKPEKTKILSVIEDGDVVKKAIIFNSSLDKTTIFYLKGSFDPNKLRKFSETEQFDNLAEKLIQEYQNPSLIQPITPNN